MELLVRYSEIHKKKGKTRTRLLQTVRQRIQDRLEYENFNYGKVSTRPGRIIISNISEELAETVAEIPGVKSCSPAKKVETDEESIKQSLPDVEESFGVRVNTTDTDFSSQELESKFGSYIQNHTGSEVDLENPETWVRIEIRPENSFIFTDVFEGPGGLPVASQGKYVALISGGIDSPVAAYEIMRRGGDFIPLYFYNRPYAAEDHLIRFKSVLTDLKKFHPSRKWRYGVVDMKEINSKLDELGKGKMVIHRLLMFQLAEKIRSQKNLQGIITGESIGQKSSQTPHNLLISSQQFPVFRPLLTEDKNDIREEAEEIGTFQYSKIDSACANMAPDSPSTRLSAEKVESLKEKIDFGDLIEKAWKNLEFEEF